MQSVSICLATIGRPSLRQTLQSILECEIPPDAELEFLIADDSRDGSATTILSESPSFSKFRIIRVNAQNIATARNACLDSATGEFLAFIDDDEIAERSWLARLLTAAQEFQADAVFGSVKPCYPPDTPAWIKQAGPFRKRVGERGARLWTGSTCNALVRRSAIMAHGLRFDEAFGKSGGEDTDLFSRLNAKGGVLVAAPEAAVSEQVPVSRLTTAHLRRRYLRSGQSYARIRLRLDNSSPVSRAVFYASRGAKCAGSALLCAATRPIMRGRSLAFAIRAWRYAGAIREALGMPLPVLYD